MTSGDDSAGQAESGAPAARASGAGGRWAGVLELLAEPTFRRLWLLGAIAGTMRWLEILAIGVFVFRLTGSPFLVALMTVLRMLPMFLFGSLAGAIAEQLDRKRLLAAGLVGMIAVAGVLGLLSATGAIEVWHIGLGAFLSGVFWSTEFPVRRTMLGEVAGLPRIGPAMALDSATNNATRMVGPALGGLLLELLGLQGAYFLGAALYAVGLLLIAQAAYVPTSPLAAGRNVFRNLLEGLAYIRGRRAIVGVLAVTVVMNTLGFPYATMVPVIGGGVLGLDATAIGLLLSSEGLGALLGAIAVALYGQQAWYTRVFLAGSLLFLCSVLIFSVSPWYALSLPLLFASGLGVAGFSAMQSTIMMLLAPPQMRSRVMGVLSVCIGTAPFGHLHVGLLAGWLGAPLAVTVIAAEGLVLVALACWYWPELRRPSP